MKKVIFSHAKNIACKNCGSKRRKAFSLVEMLMALLVASLLLAALAPVMTRKMTEDKVNVSGSLTDSIYHEYKVFTNLTTGDGNSANKEYEFEFPPNTDETDATRFGAIIVAGGGGGAGAAASDVRGPKTLSFNQGNAGGSTSSTTSAVSLPSYTDYRFNRYTDSIKLTIVSGAGGGGGGNGVTKTETPELSQSVCAGYGMGKTDTTGHVGTVNSPLIVYDSANNMCVSAYNQISSGTRTSPSPSQPYCTTYSYSGFSTPICMKDGAFNACNAFKTAMGGNMNWRLPTQTEQSKWTATFVGRTIAAGGLGGCSHSSVSGVPYCPAQDVSASKQSQWPSHIWTSTPYTDSTYCTDGGKAYYAWYLDGTSWAINGFCATTLSSTSGAPGYTYFGSVRCVLGAEPTQVFNSFSGGSGGAGSTVTINIPADVLAKAVELSDDGRGVLRVYAGHGGKGAPAYNNDGYFGQASMVAVYPSTGAGTGVGTKLWHILVPGGGGGKKASTTAGGAAGAAGGAKCSYYFPVSSGGKSTYGTDNTALSFDCSSLPGYVSGVVGEAGIKGDKGLVPAEGGKGGSMGGNGATCSGTANTTCNSGNTNGAGGSVTINYNARIAGAAGAGGGAGSAIRLVNVPIPADRKIKVSVGAGGLPGAAGASGKAGGASYIEVNGVKYETEAGKGGAVATGGNVNAVTYNLLDAQVEPYLKVLGAAGAAGGVPNSMKNNTYVKNGEFSVGTAGTKGKLDTETGYRMRMSSGGNGGINNLTLLPQQLPCGMFNNSDMTYKNSTVSCGSPSKPTPLTHGAAGIFNLAGINSYLQFLGVSGATGGGGGGWVKGVTPEAEGGSAGSSGYVVIYWGDSYNW